jgi:hypothetical protein
MIAHHNGPPLSTIIVNPNKSLQCIIGRRGNAFDFIIDSLRKSHTSRMRLFCIAQSRTETFDLMACNICL